MTTTLGAALLLTAAATLYKAVKGKKTPRLLDATQLIQATRPRHWSHPVLFGAAIGGLVSLTIGLTAVTMLGLARFGTYDSVEALVRRGYFHLLSAHTGTGFGTIPGRLFVTDWGALAPAMIVIAMALGGMASSTTGGVKALRVGVLAKAVATDMRRIVLPTDAVVVDSYHSGGRTEALRPTVARTAVLITVLYFVLYFSGAVLGMFYGYSIQEAPRWISTRAMTARRRKYARESACCTPAMSRGVCAVT
jgi:Trk-type K+ transport system membrane component